MSIQLEMTVTGGELARALLRDEEELAYALKEMGLKAQVQQWRLKLVKPS